MATHHAKPGEVVDLDSWADGIPGRKSKAIAKLQGLELARLAVDQDTEIHHSKYCQVTGPIVIHCLDGEVKLTIPDKTVYLKTGQLVYLEEKTEHTLTGVTNSVVLLTMILKTAHAPE